MNNLLNLLIVIGMCWKLTFSLEKEEKYNEITCGQSKINPRVETMLRFQRLKIKQTLGFTWTLFISKKDSKPTSDEYDYYDYDNFENNHLCKGFLIHPQVVLTTARCLEEYFYKEKINETILKGNDKNAKLDMKSIDMMLLDNIQIQNGGWIPMVSRPLIISTPFIHEQIRYVSNMSFHPGYNCSSMENNHALLLLSERFDMSKPDIGLLCLSETDDLTLQCEDVSNVYSSDVEQSKLCGTNFNLYYKEMFIMCPKEVNKINRYYYSGIYRYLVISSSRGKRSTSYYDTFVNNIDWVRSFLYENGIDDILYTI